MKCELAPLVEWLGFPADSISWDQLEAYRRWLQTEAVTAGGIGPHEAGRLTDRHIGDSIAYARHLQGSSVVDYGSGVGLPAIPLATVRPDLSVLAIDRSGRRVELMERAVNVVGLTNVVVEQGSVENDNRGHECIVTRAVFPLDRWPGLILPRLEVGGRAVTSIGAVEPTSTAPAGAAVVVDELPAGVLDHAVTFLIMTRTE